MALFHVVFVSDAVAAEEFFFSAFEDVIRSERATMHIGEYESYPKVKGKKKSIVRYIL